MPVTTEKMKFITIEDDKILAGITKVNPEDGDILIFHVKTDDQGMPLVPTQKISIAMNTIKEFLEKQNRKCGCVFLLDKYNLFSVENPDGAIRELEQVKTAIEKAAEQIRDTKNKTRKLSEQIEILKERSAQLGTRLTDLLDETAALGG